MPTRAFRLAYDGRPYHGFQRQPAVPTVEGALFDALDDLLDDATDEATDDAVSHESPPPAYSAAGRTDAGVSAIAQTVAVRVPAWLDAAALSSALPDEVRAWATADVGPGFHARHDATRRHYDYYLHAPPLVDDPAGPRLGQPVDEPVLRAALERLAGEHDFHNLTPDETGTVRDLSTGVTREGAFLYVRLSAGGFARQLVRRAVSLVTAVASGERPPGAIDRVLAAEPLSGPDGVAPAPAAPLVLAGVDYPGVTFAVDEDATAGAAAAFAGRQAAGATRAAVAGRIARTVGESAESGESGRSGRSAESGGSERDGT